MEEMKVVTVAVRVSDGAMFHWKEGLYGKELRRFINLASGFTSNATGDKWRHVVRQLLNHRRPCKVQLIVGFDGFKPILDSLIYRPIDRQPHLSERRPTPQRLE